MSGEQAQPAWARLFSNVDPSRSPNAYLGYIKSSSGTPSSRSAARTKEPAGVEPRPARARLLCSFVEHPVASWSGGDSRWAPDGLNFSPEWYRALGEGLAGVVRGWVSEGLLYRQVPNSSFSRLNLSGGGTAYSALTL